MPSSWQSLESCANEVEEGTEVEMHQWILQKKVVWKDGAALGILGEEQGAATQGCVPHG